MKFQWVRPGDAAWRQALDNTPHDVYHLPQYCVAASTGRDEDIRAALISDGEHQLLIPLLVRSVSLVPDDESVFDAASPYGYPGPILSSSAPDTREHFVRLASKVLVDALRRSRVNSAFIRLHPLLGLKPIDLHGAGILVHHGETVAVDLSKSEAEMWRETRSGHRNEINRSLRLGHVARIDDDWEHFDAFIDIYQETMGRVGASDGYLFPREYFVNLRDMLGNLLHLCVVEVEGEVAAGALFTEVNGIVEYHLSGTRSKFLRTQPTKLMLHFARLWAKERGNRYLHLGGGLGGGRDSLFSFKAGFSKLTLPFHTWRIIADPGEYAALTKRWEALSGLPADSPQGFFPAYRKPM